MLAYLIQMIACSGVLYAYYHFFLRNEKFHQYNRFYLLLSIVLSLVLPLIKIPVTVTPDSSSSSIIYAFAGSGETITVTSAHSNLYLIPYIIYAIPLILLLFRFILSIRHVIRIRKGSSVETHETIQLINTNHPDAPFSFFNWLFWNNDTDRRSADGRYILQHEMYHIRSKHSWDLVFLEIVLAACWFNPFFYLYRKEIKTIQEFLADRHATGNNNSTDYAELLLLRAMGVRHQNLVNPFFHHQIKRRIFMLTSSKKPAWQWLRKITAIPVLSLTAAIIMISCNTADQDKPANSSTTVTDIPLPGKTDSTRIHQASQPSTKEKPIPVDQNKEGEIIRGAEVFSAVEVDAKYPGNWRSFLERNLNGQVAVDNKATPGTYTTIIQFIVDKDGLVSDVKALTNVGYGMEQEAIRVIKKSGKWSPAIQNGREVKAYRKQPITFQITDA